MYYVFLCCQSTHVLGLVQIHTDESSHIFILKMELNTQTSTVVYCEWMVSYEVGPKLV
jgi:hypothetical protein